MTKTVNTDIIKARIDELQADVDRVKSEMVEFRESAKGSVGEDTFEKLDEFRTELLTLKAGQAELINLLQE